MNRSIERLTDWPRPAWAIVTTLLMALNAPVHGQPASAAPSPRTIQINGTALHYVDRGAGTPVVFVHGGVGDYRTFEPQFAALAPRFRVIAFSRRFHPPNVIPADVPAYALQVHVDDLAALVKALGLGPAHFIGHSYGAYVALKLALQRPELVRSLVLGEPPALALLESSSVGRGLLQSFQRKALQPSRDAFQAGDLENGLRRFIDGAMGDGTFDRMPPAALRRVMTFGPEMRLEMLSDASNYQPPLGCEALGKLNRPVLLISGERSVPLFQVLTRELERCLEGETHVMLPDADHSLHGRNPIEYLKSVEAFLRR